jgi:osmotically-inducible protein OsmY
MGRAVMEDHILEQRVRDELDYQPGIDATFLTIAALDGMVRLSGHVKSYAEKLTAARAVERVAGVRHVVTEVDVRPATAQQLPDVELARRATSLLEWDPMIPKNRIEVNVDNGWIILKGNVGWDYQRRRAHDTVSAITGVRGVTNLIKLQPDAPSSAIGASIKAALTRDAIAEADHIRVEVSGDAVLIEGSVKVPYERDIAERAAWSVPGVRSVDNRLQIA